ncbi:hypothetical protein OURE66S_03264 [Oligella ureolytica]
MSAAVVTTPQDAALSGMHQRRLRMLQMVIKTGVVPVSVDKVSSSSRLGVGRAAMLTSIAILILGDDGLGIQP